jgi:hypothetical protein
MIMIIVRILWRELYNTLRIEQSALMITFHAIKMIVDNKKHVRNWFKVFTVYFNVRIDLSKFIRVFNYDGG